MAVQTASSSTKSRSDLKIIVPSRMVTLRSDGNPDVSYQSIRDISEFYFRAYCFEASLRAVGPVFGHGLPVLSSFLPTGNFSQTRSTRDLLSAQNKVLSEARIHFNSETDFSYNIVDDVVLTGSFSIYDEELGSLFQRRLFTLSLPDLGQISNAVVGGLVVAALSSIPSSHQSNEFTTKFQGEDLYSCTINAWVVGPNEELVDDMIHELIGNSNQSEQPPSVWRARQLCLLAAGFDPGPIDGKYGPQTTEAEKRYSYFHGSIKVNWSSRVFARHVIIHAYRHKNSERLLDTPSSKSK